MNKALRTPDGFQQNTSEQTDNPLLFRVGENVLQLLYQGPEGRYIGRLYKIGKRSH
jgi:hypothetical protein